MSQVQPSVLLCVATNILNKYDAANVLGVCTSHGASLRLELSWYHCESLCAGACACQAMCEPVSRGCMCRHPSFVWLCVHVPLQFVCVSVMLGVGVM